MFLKVAAKSDKMSYGDLTSHSYTSPPFQRTPTPFTPSKNSPLTPLSNPSSNQQTNSSLSPPQSPPSLIKFSEVKRQHKSNPLMMSKEDVKDKRRHIFLSKIKDAREHSRLQARGGEDEMMRIILVSEQRRFHAHLARVAASIPTIEEETESQLLREAENLDYSELVEEQDKELEAILSQLDIKDGKLDDPFATFTKQTGHCQGSLSTTLCDGCGEQDSMIALEGFQVCFCCGWSAD